MLPIAFYLFMARHSKAILKSCAIISAFVVWFVGIVDALISVSLSTLEAYITAFDLNAFQQFNIAALPWIGFINAFLPVSEFVTAFTIYTLAWTNLIVFRWAKSFIPAIAN